MSGLGIGLTHGVTRLDGRSKHVPALHHVLLTTANRYDPEQRSEQAERLSGTVRADAAEHVLG